jgi:pilus assembly protein CpaB
VRVIAIDQEAKNSDGTPKLAHTATMEVAPLDAQKLALAQEVGSLSLVLRKPGEQNNPVVETVSMNDLRYNMYGGARYPAPAAVGGFSGAVAGAFRDGAATIAAPRGRSSGAHSGASKKAAKPAPGIQIYRGTTSNQYQVGG